MRIVAEEFDDSPVDDCSWSCPPVLPVPIGPHGDVKPESHILLEKTQFEATLAKVLAEGLWIFFVGLSSQ
jgi:hypothetical protein